MPAQFSKVFCEFFAGIGLVWEALKSTGWQCAYSNDIDDKKKLAFESHFGPSDHYHLCDVWNTNEVVSRIDGTPFLATASFPCTDLSIAGYWKGLAGHESSSYFGFLRVLESLGDRRPPLVMLENVTGFLNANGGADFPRAMIELARLGYWIDAFVVDARLFVPQSRPRLFIIGVHETVDSSLLIKENGGMLNLAQWRAALDASGDLHPKSLIQIMETTQLPTGWFTMRLQTPPQAKHSLLKVIDLDEGQDWWDAQQVEKHYRMMHEYHRVKIDAFVETGETFVGTVYRRTRRGAVRAEVRFDGIAGCLRTTKGGSARQIVCVVKDKKLRMRWMSPREYARLQGAADYVLGGTDNQSMFGFGDAVCVPVIQWIDQNVLTPILDTARSTRKLVHA